MKRNILLTVVSLCCIFCSAQDLAITIGKQTIVMKKIHGGSFMMGASTTDTLAEKDEFPQHKVTLKDYYLAETEVTQELWQYIMGKNPSKIKAENHPVEFVTWEDCMRFIERLNKKTGRKFRLPTEAEWEYAARGGKKSRGTLYSGSNNIMDVAWFAENCLGEGAKNGVSHQPVKSKAPNELGLYDMTGNVWEWCSDLYGLYEGTRQVNPTGAKSSFFHVFRGGGWDTQKQYCRITNRYMAVPRRRRIRIGLRLAM